MATHRQPAPPLSPFSSSSPALQRGRHPMATQQGKIIGATSTKKKKTKDALGQHTRRFQVWLKHSITHLAHPETTFEDNSRGDSSSSGISAAVSKQLKQQQDRNFEESKKSLEPCSLTLETPSTDHHHHHHHHTNAMVVSNIDEALLGFSFSNNHNTLRKKELLEQSSSSASYVPTKEWDWILDGHPEWVQQAEQSRQLLKDLYGNPSDNNNESDNTTDWNFDEWKLQFGSIGNQEYQFADFEHHEEEFLQTSPPLVKDVIVGNDNDDNDDDDFGDFQEAVMPTTQSTDIIPTTEINQLQEKELDSAQDVDDNDDNVQENDGFGDFQHAEISQPNSSTGNDDNINDNTNKEDYASGFITTDSIDMEDDGSVEHPQAIQPPPPAPSSKDHNDNSSPGERKEEALTEQSGIAEEQSLPRQHYQSLEGAGGEAEPTCSPPKEEEEVATAGMQPPTPTAHNRTHNIHPSTTATPRSYASSIIGCGDRGAFDTPSSTRQPQQQQQQHLPLHNVMIPRTLYMDEVDTDTNPESIPTTATGGGEEVEDESSLEATTNSWLSSSTIPSVVRFTSETPSKLADAVLRIPAAVRLSTPSTTNTTGKQRAITHRDLARAVDHHTYNNIINFGTTINNSISSISSKDDSNRRRYLASPVNTSTAGDDNSDDPRSIYSHEEIMASPESRFRRRHSHPDLAQNGPTYDFDDDDNHKDDDTGTMSCNDDHDYGDAHTNEDDESILRKLPKSFHYNPNYDDTAEILMHTIDWEYVPYWKLPRLLSPLPIGPEEALDHIEQVQEQITTRLSEMDTLHLQVTRRLMYNIQPHVDLLQDANGTVHELAKNLSLSQIYVQRCYDSLNQAARGKEYDKSDNNDDMVAGGGGLLGGGTLLDGWDQKRDYQQLKELLGSIDGAMQAERDLNHRVAYFDIRPTRLFFQQHEGEQIQQYQCSSSSSLPLEECRSILTLAQDLRLQVEESSSTEDGSLVSPLSQLECLEGLRQRLLHVPMTFMKRLHWWLESITIQSCGVVTAASLSLLPSSSSYCRNNYHALVKALLRVHSHQLSEQDIHLDPNNDGDKDEVLAMSWAQSIETACFFEAKRAFCVALLDPSGEEEEDDLQDSAGDRNNDGHRDLERDDDDEAEEALNIMLEDFQRQVLAHDNVWEDSEKLRTLTYSLVTIRFDWEVAFSKSRGQGHCNRPLAPIYHRLCLLLTSILHGYSSVVGWQDEYVNGAAVDTASKEVESTDETEDNKEKYGPLLLQVLRELQRRKTLIWNHSVQVLEQCLDEYLKFVGKKPLFEWKQPMQDHRTSIASSDAVQSVQDDTSWREDLEGLQDVVRLTEQFLSLRQEFTSSKNTDSRDSPIQGRAPPSEPITANDGQELNHKLHAILKKHLRTVHVEAMNSMGAMLSKEDWTLVPLTCSTTKATRKQRPPTTTAGRGPGETPLVIQRLLIDILKPPGNGGSIQRHSWGTQFCLPEAEGNHLANFHTMGNPFNAIGDDKSTATNAAEKSNKSDDADSLLRKLSLDGVEKVDLGVTMKTIYDLLDFYCGSNDPTVSGMVPKCVCSGVLKWVSRLLLVMQRLPRLEEEACKVVSNVFDLYATTVFRVCTGNAMSERFVLGIEPSSRDQYISSLDAELTRRAQETSSPLFGFRRLPGRSTPVKASAATIPAPTISPNLEAELCVPLPSEFNELTPLRTLITNAQEGLKGIVKLDLVDHWVADPTPTAADTRQMFADRVARVLEKRQAASWSCLFLAAALQLAGVMATSAHGNSSNGDTIRERSPATLKHLQDYVDTFLSATLPLVTLSNRVSCVRAIRAKGIVQEIVIVGSGWEEAKLHEHPNLYVDSLCDLCALIWCSLSAANRLPSGAMKRLWEDLVSGGYVALLDGFSRVPFCSTEGRALMSMDLASFSSGISPRSVLDRMEEQSLCSLPPPQKAGGTASSLRGMAYVDTFIKVFYYPKMDVVEWIQENYVNYQFSHCIALILGTSSSPEQESPSVSELIRHVRKLYKNKEGSN